MQEMQKKLNKKNQDRLAQALRANLRKRKEQQCSRAEAFSQHKKCFYIQKDEGFLLYIRLSPNAMEDKIHGLYETPEGQVYLKASVKDIAENNNANTSLIELIAKKLRLPKTNISFMYGGTNRNKILLLRGNNEEIEHKLKQILDPNIIKGNDFALE